MLPLIQKLSSGGACLLPVTTEDVLVVQPSNWGAPVTLEINWDESSNFCWCLGVTGGMREERRNTETGGSHKDIKLQQGAGWRENIVYFLVALLFWDLRNSFKTPWATERDDNCSYTSEKVSGLLPLQNLLLSSDSEELEVCAVNFISLISNPAVFVMTVISDSTWLCVSERFSNDRTG